MKIETKTVIPQPKEVVFEGLNKELFIKLMGTDVEILSFGSRENEKVEFLLKKPFKGYWLGEITSYSKNPGNDYFFIDEGRKLPFGLKQWQHHHIVSEIDEKSCLLIDRIFFQHKIFFITPIMGLFFYFSMKKRKPTYKNHYTLYKNEKNT